MAVALLSGSALALPARGQTYAPDTEFHDPVQRVFIVEAARILAWRENQKTNQIAEITYRVATDGVTTWQIEWLDSNGKALKTAKVEYPEANLKQGPDFYRQAFRQLWAAGWRKPDRMETATCLEDFWRGASLAGYSREQSLSRAFGLTETVSAKENDRWVPQMAGLLVHASLPGMAGHLSLDWVLVARGAAWLALTEQACSCELSQPWSPVLFLAGRERGAAQVWQKDSAGSTVKKEIVAAWNLWLSRPTSKQTFLFAVDSSCSPISLGMLAYDVQVNGAGKLLAELSAPMLGSEKRFVALHNYAPLFACQTGVGGGHVMNGVWPVVQRSAWLELLASSPSSPQEKIDFNKELQAATNALAKLTVQDDSKLDPCLMGFKEMAPLLKLGYAEGTGKLLPTAVATRRDLLNYGWEATGLQMGSRYRFVNSIWCVPDRAKPIVETVTREVPGLLPFFQNAKQADAYNYLECQLRLQSVDGFYRLVGWSEPPSWAHAGTNGNAETFVRRCWLRPTEFEWQARALWDVGEFARITQLTENFQQEGGSLAAALILSYLTSIRSDLLKPVPRASELLVSLAEAMPQPSRMSVNAVWKKRFEPLPPLERAQALEKVYWTNPDSEIENMVAHYYGQAGAFKSVRRFYVEARENFVDPVGVSNGIGQSAFVTGYCLNDEKLRQMALEDSASGSFSDMMMHICDAAIRDDRNGLKKIVGELIERYEPKAGANSPGHLLRDFLPLLPDLADPKSPRHAEAVNYFKKSNSWNLLRWIWIEKFNLSKEDGITFLGGRETASTVRVMVCCLDNDAAGAKQALQQMIEKNENQSTPLTILSSYACRRLTKESLANEPPDLKPSDAVSTRSAVLAKLKVKRS